MSGRDRRPALSTLVVGGGIGGLAAALALAQRGRAVHLLERAPGFGELGAGLQVGPNAVRMLDRLGVLDRALAGAVRPSRAVVMDALTGRPLTALDLGPRFRERYGYPYVVLHRGDLLAVLLDACRALPLVTLENDKTVTEVRADADEAGVRCADGSQYRAELLVGADGLNSRVRTLIDDSPARNSGYVAYRGTLPMREAPPDAGRDEVRLWIGPAMHLMQYPVRDHEVYNQVAVFRSERFRLRLEPYGTVEELESRFAGACETVRGHVSLISTERNWPVFDRDPLATWIHGRAVLLGDAAHPMLQYLGQGACQALEDAVALADAVAGRADLAAALADYERRRIGRASRCQLSARPWGEVWHTDDEAMLGLRRRVFAGRRADDYSELDWLYLDDDTLRPATGGIR
ncbi:FAD-dependent monooxygenase [Dactylosporangium sp. CA-092794]|uniref:FAD-dependent monooxygenase n=1 Tax=Dactylosporangium sp. CA-092794 TaxID=3239929 RepID=UPI003D9049C6